MQVFKISLGEVDVKEATPEQCAVHSGYNSPKIDVREGHFRNINVNFDNEPPTPSSGTTNETTVYEFSHEYNYTPQVWLHGEYSRAGTSFRLYGPGRLVMLESAGTFAHLKATADDEKVYLKVEKGWTSPASTPDIAGRRVETRLYIFAEEAF